MKLKILISVISVISVSAFADLTAIVTPGHVYGSTERPTTSTLNRLGQPTIQIVGTIGGTNAGISAKSINGGHMTDAFAGSNLTWDATSPRRLVIADEGVSYNQLSSNAFAGSLQGGSGAPVTNRTDNVSIIVNANRQLTIATNATVETVLTNTDYILMFSTRTNGTGGGTNKVFELTTMTTLFNFVSNSIIPVTFSSSLTSVAAGKIIDTAHGFSNAPTWVRGVVVCQTADASGYSVEDEVDVQAIINNAGDAAAGVSFGANSTNVYLTFRGSASLQIVSKTNATSSAATFTAANWKARIDARP